MVTFGQRAKSGWLLEIGKVTRKRNSGLIVPALFVPALAVAPNKKRRNGVRRYQERRPPVQKPATSGYLSLF